MAIRYTRKQLIALEQAVVASEYVLRYEKGQFRSASCRVHGARLVVINKYLSLESKIEYLAALLQQEGSPLPLSVVRLLSRRKAASFRSPMAVHAGTGASVRSSVEGS